MRHEVTSTSIKTIEETPRKSLIVEFHKGQKFEYFGVPLEVIQEFIEADSVGRFFNENIRGQYREERRS